MVGSYSVLDKKPAKCPLSHFGAVTGSFLVVNKLPELAPENSWVGHSLRRFPAWDLSLNRPLRCLSTLHPPLKRRYNAMES